MLRSTYGWAALQWQGWARGELTVGGAAERALELWVEGGALEVRVAGRSVWGGDFFGFRRAPVVVRLAPGRHVVEVRLVRDVRAMGGVDAVPALDVGIEVKEMEGVLAVRDGSVLVSDIVDGRLPSPFATVSVTNAGNEWIRIVDIVCTDVGHAFLSDLCLWMQNSVEVQPGSGDEAWNTSVAPGQTRPLPFRITLVDPNARMSSLDIHFQTNPQQTPPQRISFVVHFQHTSLHSPQKVTHPHPSGIVSYAIIRPLSEKAACRTDASNAPVLLLLHGAGVEAENPIVRAAFDSLPDICAWVVCPSGVTTWSSDDWRKWPSTFAGLTAIDTWGAADVANSVYFLLSWTETMGWSGRGVDISKVLASGHSNGGKSHVLEAEC
jgi:hypothetical protein